MGVSLVLPAWRTVRIVRSGWAKVGSATNCSPVHHGRCGSSTRRAWASLPDMRQGRATAPATCAERGRQHLPDVALVHDYFVQDGGGERVAIELARLLPTAEIYTSFFDADSFSDRIDPARVHSWPLQGHVNMRDFRRLVHLYPLYFSALDLRDAQLVVSSSSAFAKAVRTSRRATHVSYIHTPMRFAYDTAAYFSRSSFGIAARAAGQTLRMPLAMWDRRTARQPDILVANSETVRQRIRERWGRDAEVIHPPVSVSEFEVSTRDDAFFDRRATDCLSASGRRRPGCDRRAASVGDRRRWTRAGATRVACRADGEADRLAAAGRADRPLRALPRIRRAW